MTMVSTLRGRRAAAITIGAMGLLLLAFAPVFANSYVVALLINLLLYAVLATAWGLFSGTTGYVSLATVSFFGVGSYAVAVLAERLPWPIVLLVAAVIGALLALVVGLATLRLSGIVFVIFTFGLSELVRQVVTWYEARIAGSVGRYVFLDVTPAAIYWQLLALALAVLLSGGWVARSRLGFALRLIGEDEAAARHCGVNTTRAKLVMFTASSVFMVLAGAIVAPRWTYIDAAIAFNPLVSFQVVVMALLGGAGRVYGPLLGVLPVVLLFEVFVKYFPNHFSIVLGLVFLVIVYLLPGGVIGLVPRMRAAGTERA
jgi:branched-chain amino acid transport system permease protein